MRRSILAKIIDLFFPRFCPICGNRLVGEEESICLSCNLHLPRTDTWEKPYDNEMAKMFWHQIPIEKACALFYYKGHSFVSNVLYQLKYNNRPEIASDMGKLLAQEGMRINFVDGIDGIIPLPIYTDIVRRTSFKESQTHKNRWQRQQNVEQVFELAPKYKTELACSSAKESPSHLSLDGKHFLIIDDVCTTGATIIACCKTLMEAEPNIHFSVLSIGWAKN